MVPKAIASITKRRDEYEEALKIDKEIIEVLGKEPKTVLSELKKINFKIVRSDVERFLEDKNELKLLQFEIIKDTLSREFQ